MTAARKVAVPSLGTRRVPESTKAAPSGPPIQFHQGAVRISPREGKGGRVLTMNSIAQIIVPVIEKKAAYHALPSVSRREPFAAAWIAINMPAVAAIPIKNHCMK